MVTKLELESLSANWHLSEVFNWLLQHLACVFECFEQSPPACPCICTPKQKVKLWSTFQLLHLALLVQILYFLELVLHKKSALLKSLLVSLKVFNPLITNWNLKSKSQPWGEPPSFKFSSKMVHKYPLL